MQYYLQVYIGTPPQLHYLDADTGSTDIWVWSTLLSTDTLSNMRNRSVFNPEASSSFKRLPNVKWYVFYADTNTASGHALGTDVITLGSISIKNQAIELPTNISALLSKQTHSGYLGLGLGRRIGDELAAVPTVVENLLAQSDSQCENKVFTAHLGSVRHTGEEAGKSFFTFGGFDWNVLNNSGIYDINDISYTKINPSIGAWMFDSNVTLVNEFPIRQAGNQAVADTGSTYTMLSEKVCEYVYNAIPNAKKDPITHLWSYPTSQTNELPVVKLSVGSQLYEVRKEYFGYEDLSNGYTLGAIQSRLQTAPPVDILGDTFLKGVYAVRSTLVLNSVLGDATMQINPTYSR